MADMIINQTTPLANSSWRDDWNAFCEARSVFLTATEAMLRRTDMSARDRRCEIDGSLTALRSLAILAGIGFDA